LYISWRETLHHLHIFHLSAIGHQEAAYTVICSKVNYEESFEKGAKLNWRGMALNHYNLGYLWYFSSSMQYIMDVEDFNYLGYDIWCNQFWKIIQWRKLLVMRTDMQSWHNWAV
jgi:hypothetical protein